jgi:N-methylhydantoinase B/oxoprolinase/acetone carboxylase alpha subunit
LNEVLRHELAAINEEMALAVSRTARSPIVKTGDFATAMTDAEGRIIAEGYAAPFQLAILMATIREFKKTRTPVEAGDVFITNDPFAGAGHLPDVTVFAPVHSDSQLVGFTMIYSHHTDIGGRFPGGFSSWASSTYEEGIRLTLIKLDSAGRRNDQVVKMILANVRGPDVWWGDLEAKLAGVLRGARELQNLVKRYGYDRLVEYYDMVCVESEQAARLAISQIPPGVYRAEASYRDQHLDGSPMELVLKAELRVAEDTVTVSFPDAPRQIDEAINVPIGMTRAMVFGVLKMIVGPRVQLNDGFVRPIDVQVADNTILNPRHPAAVGGRSPMAFLVFDVVARALAKALPMSMPVPGDGADMLHFQSASGTVIIDSVFGGWGGRPTKDGIDGVAPMQFGSYGTISAELLELDSGVIVESFGFIPDSAGPGKYRGSLSVFRQWRFEEPGVVMLRTSRLLPSDGLAGGQPGFGPQSRLIRDGVVTDLPARTHVQVQVKRGDRIFHSVSGVGGFGPALERDPALVVADILGEKLSSAAASEQYGVVVKPGNGTKLVDADSTVGARRKALKSSAV